MQLKKLGPLEATVIEPPQGQAVATLVLLHGFGAPGTDLVGLAHELSMGGAIRFIFPQAPLLLDPSAGPLSGRAWWHIDMMELQMARLSGKFDQLASDTPDGIDAASEGLELFLSAVCKNYGLQEQELLLGGFSQGAMLSCHLALARHFPVKALVQLSGTVLCEAAWKNGLEKRKENSEYFPVFQSHSPEDQVLPFALAQRLTKILQAGNCPTEFVSFEGGHGISRSVIDGLGKFLKSQN